MGVNVSKGSKYIYTFEQGNADGDSSMRELLGGKGANLAEMCNLNLPVPAGLTITTEACLEYRKRDNFDDKNSFVKRLAARAMKYLKHLNKEDHLPLVSVRSGARVSMAGMMDTILNVGHSTGRFSELFPILGARTTLDSYRRLQQMYGATVLDIPEAAFELALTEVKDLANVSHDSELNENDLMTLIKVYDKAYEAHGSMPLALDYENQLAGAIQAVFDSWDNERAKVYRKHHNIPEEWGTAVNIQFMVFGNAQGVSGSGVMFSRNTSTGENKPVGEFLMDAQGEDVVAGVRTPEQLGHLQMYAPDAYDYLLSIAEALELHYNDVQDLEFTIEDNQLYILQTRDAKRTATAEVKIASDFLAEGKWDICDLAEKLNPVSFNYLNRPVLEPSESNTLLAKGMGTGGVASGVVATNKEDALTLHASGKEFILWSHETTPNDLEAMLVANAIVTEVGGQTCHAAVVARSLNLPCVVGTGKTWTGEHIVTVDANDGKVYSGLVQCTQLEEPDYVRGIITYIAETLGLLQSGDVKDAAQYALVSKPCEVAEGVKEFVLDIGELGQSLRKTDEDLLDLVGMTPDQYRCELFKERLEGSPFAWVNELVQQGTLPKERHVVAGDWGDQCSLVTMVTNALGFSKVDVIDCPDDLILGKAGMVDEKKLINILGGALFDYIKTKAIEDGVYPKEIERVHTRDDILAAL